MQWWKKKVSESTVTLEVLRQNGKKANRHPRRETEGDRGKESEGKGERERAK